MNYSYINNWAVGLAVFSFGFLSMGSVFFGATVTTSLLRGFWGAIFFGIMLWLVGVIFSKEGNLINKNMLERENISNLEQISVETRQTKPKDK